MVRSTNTLSCCGHPPARSGFTKTAIKESFNTMGIHKSLLAEAQSDDDTRIANCEVMINGCSMDISALQSQMAQAQAEIDTLQSEMDTAQTDIAALQSSVSSAQ